MDSSTYPSAKAVLQKLICTKWRLHRIYSSRSRQSDPIPTRTLTFGMIKFLMLIATWKKNVWKNTTQKINLLKSQWLMNCSWICLMLTCSTWPPVGSCNISSLTRQNNLSLQTIKEIKVLISFYYEFEMNAYEAESFGSFAWISELRTFNRTSYEFVYGKITELYESTEGFSFVCILFSLFSVLLPIHLCA